MSVNLLTTIQKNLGYPLLKKVDPNTQDVKQKSLVPDIQRFAQAAIPCVLAGINNLAKSDKGCYEMAYEPLTGDWLHLLFGDNKAELVSNVSAYSLYERSDVVKRMNQISGEAVRIIREHSKKGEDLPEMKKFIAAQRTHFFSYLPAIIDLGHLVNDDTIDDRTHKMQGPVSSLMHKIESSFGGSETAEDAEKRRTNF